MSDPVDNAPAAEDKFDDDFEAPSPPASPEVANAAPKAAPTSPAAGEQDALDKQLVAKSPKNTSKINENKELKARTAFSNATNDGVLKRTTFIHKLSTYRSAPEVSIASRGENMFKRSGVSPAPGAYNLPLDSKTKFKTSTCSSFGGSSRFGLGTAPGKLAPGPGQYQPRDPSLEDQTKVGFGTSVRNPSNTLGQAPGPGAYEQRSTVGGGMMFTARGRQVTSFTRSRSQPGPGAYTPVMTGAQMNSPKPSFGSSVREDICGVPTNAPGPGAYEMHNFKSLGKDSVKYSATSRRRMHDLSSYVTPGPGTYNAHATSFGSPGAYSCQHVDEGYKARNPDSLSRAH